MFRGSEEEIRKIMREKEEMSQLDDAGKMNKFIKMTNSKQQV